MYVKMSSLYDCYKRDGNKNTISEIEKKRNFAYIFPFSVLFLETERKIIEIISLIYPQDHICLCENVVMSEISGRKAVHRQRKNQHILETPLFDATLRI